MFMIASPQQPLGGNVNIEGNEILIIVPNCKANRPTISPWLKLAGE
jgi:hypothetical protein